MPEKIYRNAAGKIVATLLRKRLRKEVIKSRHLFRNANGWGLDRKIIEQAKADGCEEIEVTDTENQIVYTISLDKFSMHYMEIDFGHGVQWVVPLKFWRAVSSRQDELPL